MQATTWNKYTLTSLQMQCVQGYLHRKIIDVQFLALQKDVDISPYLPDLKSAADEANDMVVRTRLRKVTQVIHGESKDVKKS